MRTVCAFLNRRLSGRAGATLFDDLIFNAGPSWAPNHFVDDHLKQAIHDLFQSADNTGCSPELTVVDASGLEAVRSRMPEF
jgi:hypothetical protein